MSTTPRREIEKALRSLSDTELAARFAEAQAARRTAWAAWERVRDAGQHDLHCAEFQTQQALSHALGPYMVETGRREFAQQIALFAPPPLSGPGWDQAWIDGPGSDAL